MRSLALGRMICGDARHLDRITDFGGRPVQSIITSPPYLDTQNYGATGQVGYGQSQEEYLADLRMIFGRCHDISARDATMWLVVGAVRRNGRLIQLPEMLTNLAAEVGWTPREQVTWAKGKSLPWARSGEFRDVTEQVVLLSKSNTFFFDESNLLSPDPASLWWRRYPERYSPRGRRATNLWQIQIPTQGSWKQSPAHLCPFPQELTFRMISITSRPNDVVFDPFAGIGSVPAMAHAMGRLGYGVELSARYVERFPETLRQANDWFAQRKLEMDRASIRHRVFYDTIVELRLLKFASVLGRQLLTNGIPVEWIHVAKSRACARVRHKIIVGEFTVKISNQSQEHVARQFLDDVSVTRPLSKFGIEPVVVVFSGSVTVASKFWYGDSKFWRKPTRTMPDSPGFHLSADFRPRVEDVVELDSSPIAR